MIQQAKNEGADGLVNVNYQMHEKGSALYGTVIKFEEALIQYYTYTCLNKLTVCFPFISHK